mmetsp:Transcript_58720/g.130849  ORF Transcript_58720/g.130849 Transcript_58720/m.130849 type:complete len:255 (-) Transcript_58720:534-1298(-)
MCTRGGTTVAFRPCSWRACGDDLRHKDIRSVHAWSVCRVAQYASRCGWVQHARLELVGRRGVAEGLSASPSGAACTGAPGGCARRARRQRGCARHQRADDGSKARPRTVSPSCAAGRRVQLVAGVLPRRVCKGHRAPALPGQAWRVLPQWGGFSGQELDDARFSERVSHSGEVNASDVQSRRARQRPVRAALPLPESLTVSDAPGACGLVESLLTATLDLQGESRRLRLPSAGWSIRAVPPSQARAAQRSTGQR